MGHAQSSIAASLSVSCVYLVYVHIYCSYKLLKTNVLNERLPSFVYLYMKYVARAATRRTGYLHAAATRTRGVVYTVLNCRMETPLLRRFCCAAGYGWDYPDTEYRDVPMCFPEILCRRLLLMVLTDDNFRLSPAGLFRVRQSLKTFQPVDELKKGPFTLQVRVQEYRQVDAGVEVDVGLSAASRTGCPVWESVLTLLSRNGFHKASRSLPKNAHGGQPDEPAPDTVRQIEVRVPRTTGLQCVWFFSDYSPYRLLSLSARLFGSRSQTAPGLWMLSVCLAEIEKHKGVGVITAPVNITAEFKEPLLVPGRVTIKFWEKNVDQSPAQDLSFHMQQHGSNTSHVMGSISR
ncbi:uncharacterized protein si:ch211-12e13.1 [Cebidichthys violaceus]|uniref:uncharacterized protein si:ch211-12e13.1 n=1 Tax=Cebidichthys violaceus TaxID=271503 RepID=UPI0035CB4D43